MLGQQAAETAAEASEVVKKALDLGDGYVVDAVDRDADVADCLDHVGEAGIARNLLDRGR